jgi:hypothetical protein
MQALKLVLVNRVACRRRTWGWIRKRCKAPLWVSQGPVFQSVDIAHGVAGSPGLAIGVLSAPRFRKAIHRFGCAFSAATPALETRQA